MRDFGVGGATSLRMRTNDSFVVDLFGVMTFCGLCLYVMAPFAAPGILIGTTITALSLRSRNDIRNDNSWFSYITIALLTFVLWMFVSLLWSPNTVEGFKSACNMLLFAGAIILTCMVAPSVPSHAMRRIALAAVLAAAVGVAVLIVEVISSMMLRRVLFNLLPIFKVSPSDGTIMADGRVLSLPSFLIKKNIAAGVLIFWPVLLMATTVLDMRRFKLAIAAGVGLSFLVVALGGHDTSKIAAIVSVATFALAWLNRNRAHTAVIAGWTFLVLAPLPLMLAAYQFGLHKMSVLPPSGQHRIIIWGQTSQLALAKPFLGGGLAVTRYLDAVTADKKTIEPGTPFPAGTNVHSHNVFLQTWHELGGVGASLLWILGLTLLNWMRRVKAEAAPYVYASFAASVAMASFSWSSIASWFMASFGLVAVLTQLAVLSGQRETECPATKN